MGRRGPRPTPTKILQLHGSWRGDANRLEPEPPPGAPPCPDWLGDDARAVWCQAVEQLALMKVLTAADGNALARYADAFVRWRKAADFIAKNGEVYTLKDKDGKAKCVVPWPQVSIYNQLGGMLTKLEQEFGLTPASRTRIQVTKDDEVKDLAAQGKRRFFGQAG